MNSNYYNYKYIAGMGYWKINNWVNTNNEPSILTTKNWAEVTNDAYGNKQVKSKTLMLD